MTIQHTPGPWFRYDHGGEMSPGNFYGPQYSDCVWGPDGPGHGLIADCSPNGQIATVGSKANARLIAAAPDLLRLLKQLRREAGGWIEGRNDEADALLDAVDAVIAQVEGTSL